MKHTLEIGAYLSQWLNTAQGKPPSPHRVRIAANPAYEEICDLVRQFNSLELALRDSPIAEVPEHEPSRFLSDSQGARLRDSINAYLALNPVVRSLIVVGANSVEFGWLSPASKIEQRKTLGKAQIIQMVCDLADTGMLTRIKQCQLNECNHWFIAKRANMSYCNVKCRRRHQATSETFKAHRRQYMKALYQTHKNHDTK